ncbi:hypothetical protein FF38_13239 [Lucilia cuprina]|uniref:Uncharacterized protein n=1 Tax=Lucilia cuprina TaxID=7375 RepID=A0A0L0BUC0_LUCCU|nr:hypothetical protein FF38_13239 [Lucilia cuprina]
MATVCREFKDGLRPVVVEEAVGESLVLLLLVELACVLLLLLLELLFPGLVPFWLSTVATELEPFVAVGALLLEVDVELLLVLTIVKAVVFAGTVEAAVVVAAGAVAAAHNNPNAVAVVADVADTTVVVYVADCAVECPDRQRDVVDIVAGEDDVAEMWPLRALDKRVYNDGLDCLNVLFTGDNLCFY